MRVRIAALLVILILALGPLSALSPAEAQNAGTVYRIGLLWNTSPPGTGQEEAFLQGLRDHGYVEGKNVVLETRWAGFQYERFPELAAELVRLSVDVIVADNTYGAALAAKNATTTIPIVVPHALSPEETGLVASLARPGGNVTGFAYAAAVEIAEKKLELLLDLTPGASRVALLWPRDMVGIVPYFEATRRAASTRGVTLQSIETRRPEDLERAFSTILAGRADALLVWGGYTHWTQRKRIIDFAATNRLPAVYSLCGSVPDGGLACYSPDLLDPFREAAGYVDRILKGAKPADLPVQQPTRYEVWVNLNAARTLGITIPPVVRVRADKMIE